MVPYTKFHRDVDTPIYRQIAEQLIALIRNRTLTAGASLPTVRSYAKELHVSLETMQKAYHELQAGGWIASIPGRGTQVTARVTQAPIPVPSFVADRSAMFVRKMRDWMHVPGVIPVSGGARDMHGDVLKAMQANAAEAVSRAVRTESLDVFGLRALRSQLAGWLTEDGIAVPVEQICVVNGTQQALGLIATLTVKQDEIVYVPHMTYLAATEIFRDRGAKIRVLQQTASGVDFSPLESALASHERVSMVYAMPNGQFPTGGSWTLEQKQRLLQLSRLHGFSIIEDDYYAGFYFTRTPPVTLRALAEPTDHLFYIRSFSSILHHSFRLGMMICPPSEILRLEREKYLADTSTSQYLQYLLLLTLESGVITQAMEKQRARLKDARDLAIASCQRWLPTDCQVHVPSSGLSLWVNVPTVLGEAFFEACLAEQVLVMPGEAFSVEEPLHGFQLHFGTIEPSIMEEGIRRIGNILRRQGLRSS